MNRKKWYTGMGTVSPLVRLAVLILGFIVAVFIAFKLSGMTMDFNHLSKSIAQMAVTPEPDKLKCGMSKPCPVGHFSFKMWSGAANVIGPRICLEDELLMSHVLNNVGRGINIAVVDGKTGKVNETTFFDMWQGNVADFTKFLKEVKEGFIVMMASFDDPGTKLNDEAKKLIDDMGSTYIHGLDKRDSWLFVGGKGLQNKSPFEQHLQNDPNNNKFDGWPDVIVMEGCLPQREH